jgi:mannitol/fructose-specific phosphotransferase system IIA component (Ntr-type)
MTLLRSAFGQDSFAISQLVTSREEAITLAGKLLVASGRVQDKYVSSMLEAVEKFGAYIVIAPGIALAHGKPDESVIETGMSLVLLEQAIEFVHEQNDPVSLVFGLAAKDHSSHIGLMAELADLLGNPTKVGSLLKATEIDQLREILV